LPIDAGPTRQRSLVTEGDRRPVGIFTGRDAVHRVLAEGEIRTQKTLGEVMTRRPDTMP
jgi:CBS domain-containing protein